MADSKVFVYLNKKDLLKTNIVAFYTIATREIKRFLKSWVLTLLQPVVMSLLYFVVFGFFLGNFIDSKYSQQHYYEFIFPGLVIMPVIYHSYLNVSSSLILSKYYRHIEEILVSPVACLTILVAYIFGGVARGVMVGLLVIVAAQCFVPIKITHPIMTFVFIILISMLFATAGFINGIIAKKIEEINMVLVVIITPLTFLGGVFYDVTQLPEILQNIAYLNPITALIDAVRFGFDGNKSFSLLQAVSVILVLESCMLLYSYFLLTKFDLD